MNLPEWLENTDLTTKPFEHEQELFGWHELAKNEVVMEHLKGIFKLTEQNLMQFFASSEDVRDLTKAKLFGAWSIVKELLDKAEQAKVAMNNKVKL